MHAVGSEESVGETLAEAVLENRVSKVAVGRLVVTTQRSGGHADLHGGREMFQNLPPVAFLPRAATMALVNDNEIEEVGLVFLIKSRPVFVLGDGLVGGEIHLPTFNGFTVLDLVACISERDEGFVLRIVHEDVPVGQEQDFWSFDRIVAPVPAGGPKFVADLERDYGLSCASRHGDKHPVFPAHDGIDGTIDCDLLVVTRRAFGVVVEGRENPLDCGRGQRRGAIQTCPEFVRGWETIDASLNPCGEVELDDAFAVCGIGEFQIENLGVFFGLREACAGSFVVWLCLNDRDREVGTVAQEVIRAFRFSTNDFPAHDADAALRIGEDSLFRDAERRIFPPCSLKQWDDVFSTCVGFVHDVRLRGSR